MSQLFGYFTNPKVDSEGQLKAAQQKAKSYSKETEDQARAAGFRNADEMMVYMRARKQGGTTQGSRKLDLSALMALHPKTTIGRASDALREVNEGMR